MADLVQRSKLTCLNKVWKERDQKELPEFQLAPVYNSQYGHDKLDLSYDEYSGFLLNETLLQQ